MRRSVHRCLAVVAGFALLLAGACGYRYWAGPLVPSPGLAENAAMEVSDDGSVTYTQGRLEISVRPMTDEELNRQFPGMSDDGAYSLNPYTFGNWIDPELDRVPRRFTVFRLRVKNYMYPKVLVDPLVSAVTTLNGREYAPFSLDQLEDYYMRFITGYAGNRYSDYKERRALLRNTMYHPEMVFSGQEREGYVVFPALHPDVSTIRLALRNVAIRFDVWNEPLETVDLDYGFEREIGRVRGEGQAVESL